MTTTSVPAAAPGAADDDVVTFPGRMPKPSDAVPQRGRLLLVVLVAICAVVGVAGVVFLSLQAEEAEGVWLSILFALLPLPFLWAVYWWLDRAEPEPRRYKIAAFVWGGVVAVAIAVALEILAQRTWDLSDQAMATFVAPAVEEPAKCLFLLLTFVRARRVLDGFVDGLVLAGIVGLGFAFVENIGYYAASYVGAPEIPIEGAEGATTTFVVRGVFSPFAHPLFTSAFGIALGLAVARRSRWAKVLLGVAGLLVSMLLHGVWNGSASYAGPAWFLLSYLALAAVLMAVGVFAILVRVRQVGTLGRSLAYIGMRGWIHPDEVPWLTRFDRRRRARRHAREHHGKQAAKIVGRYQSIATEVGFLHHAVMTGRTKPRGVERTYALLDEMDTLRPYVRLPPPLPRAPHAGW